MSDANDGAELLAHQQEHLLGQRWHYGLAMGNAHGQILALFTLHAPVETAYGHVCEGCDTEGYECEPPMWPCRTALILLDEEAK